MSNDVPSSATHGLLAIVGSAPSKAPVVPYTELLALLREAGFFVSFPNSGANHPEEREKVARRIEQVLATMGAKPWFPHQGLARYDETARDRFHPL